MIKKFIISLFIGLVIIKTSSNSQIIQSIPVFPSQDDSVVIIFNASLGNKGLMGYTGDVYAHTGVITNESTTSSDWKHAPVWGDNSPKYKLVRIDNDIYQLKISPSIKEYYSITTNEQVKQLAFVFRSADKTKEGKTESNGDIFYDVYTDSAFVFKIFLPEKRNFVADKGSKIIINAQSNNADSINLIVNEQKIISVQEKSLIDTFQYNQKGKYLTKVVAYKEDKQISDSFYCYISDTTKIEALPENMNDGINYINDSTVLLCIVALNKKKAFVIGEFNNWQADSTYQMKLTPDSNRFWIYITHLQSNKEYVYQYIVDDLIIADPYAHKILDPVNDKFINSNTYPNLKEYPYEKTTGIVSVLQTSKSDYEWRITDYKSVDKEKLIIYELLVRDFNASHSFQGVIDSLNYLKNLGINAIELMPVAEFEGNESWGYNPSFYFAVDKYYGTEQSLKQLIDSCHSMGIAVIMDIVLNHSFDQCPLVQLYWDSKNNRPSSESPWYNPVAKHDYNVGNDFNHESKYTKQFVSQVLKYWLTEFKADGFRFDLSKGFTQKNTLGNVSAWGAYDSTRIKILKTIADTVWKTNPNAYVILEHFADNQEEKELASYGMLLWGNLNQKYRDASMGWNESSKSDFSWGSYKVRGFSAPNLITYMESHDEERVLYSNMTWGNNSNPLYPINSNLETSLKRAELCAVFFLTIPGPKMIWQFGELGYDYSINYNGRLGNKPIKWDYYLNPNRYRLFSVYKELNYLKNYYPAFTSTNFSLSTSALVKTISINHETMNIVIVGNFDIYPQSADITFSNDGWWYDYFSNDSIYVSDNKYSIRLNISEYKLFTSKKIQKHHIINAPEARNVKIFGKAGTGNILSVTYNYYDIEDDPEGSTVINWYRSNNASGLNKVKISTKSSSEYQLSYADSGYYIIAEVIPYAKTGILLKGLPEYDIISFSTLIKNTNNESLSLFPNPANEFIILSFNEPAMKEVKVRIMDIYGQIVKEFKISKGTRSKTLFVNDLKSGIYIVSTNSSQTIKFVKE